MSRAEKLARREALRVRLEQEANPHPEMKVGRLVCPTTARGWVWRAVKRVEGRVSPDGLHVVAGNGTQNSIGAVHKQIANFWEGKDLSGVMVTMTAVRGAMLELAGMGIFTPEWVAKLLTEDLPGGMVLLSSPGAIESDIKRVMAGEKPLYVYVNYGCSEAGLGPRLDVVYHPDGGFSFGLSADSISAGRALQIAAFFQEMTGRLKGIGPLLDPKDNEVSDDDAR